MRTKCAIACTFIRAACGTFSMRSSRSGCWNATRKENIATRRKRICFLDRAKPSYAGGILEMANLRLYPFWNGLTEGLRTGQPQNEAKSGGGNPFDTIYADPKLLESFLRGMTGISLAAAIALAKKFPWKDYQTFIDIGTAQGALPVQVALAHPHLTGGGFDLEVVRPVFEKYMAGHGLVRPAEIPLWQLLHRSAPNG